MRRIIRGILKNFLKEKEPSHIEKIETQFQRNVESEEVKDPIAATAEYVTGMIKDPGTNSEAVLAATIDSETPNKLFGAVVRQIAQEPTIPNSTIAKAVDSSKTTVSDETIARILAGIPFKSPSDRRLLIQNIKDKGLREEQIIEVLTKYYEGNIGQYRDTDVAKRLEELYSSIDFDNVEIDQLSLRIIAKQMAVMYHTFTGAAMPQRFKNVPPATVKKMMKADMPKIVGEEYEKLYPKEIARYNPETVRKAILRELAPEIAAVYEKTKNFMIPESESITKLTDDEINYFINEIFGRVDLDEKEKVGARIDIEKQIKAQYDIDEHAQKELDTKLGMLSKAERIQMLVVLNAILDSKKLGDTVRIIAQDPLNALDVIGKIGSTGTLEDIIRVPGQDRRALIAAVGESVKKRFDQPDGDNKTKAPETAAKATEPEPTGKAEETVPKPPEEQEHTL